MVSQDKLKIVNDIRKRVELEKVVSPSIMNKYPLRDKKEMYIDTRSGKSHVYMYYPLENKEVYPLYINMHGGGFVKRHSEMDEFFCRKVVNNTGCVVIDIDYKTAPEFMFPYALYECYDVIKWAYQNSRGLMIDKDKIAVGGHSAGANLSAGIALMANENKEFSLCCELLDYPVLDLYNDPYTKSGNAKAISVEKEKFYIDMYIKSEDKQNPFASPIFYPMDKLKGIPFSVIITAEFDNFCDEAEKYALMLSRKGTEVMIKCFLGCSHGFTMDCREDYKRAEKMIFKSLKMAFYN